MTQRPEDPLDQDDGLVASDAGDWAGEKHSLLARYVEATWRARQRWGEAAYVDLYCGPGRQYVERSDKLINGSPVVAWVASKLKPAPFGRVFIADKENYVLACEKRLQKLHAPVTVAALNAQECAHVVANRMDPQGLHLVFADPYNLKDLPWSVFEPLHRFEHIDFIVHFSQSDLTRNLDLYFSQNPSPLDKFAPGWRAHVERGGKVNNRGQFFEYWVKLWNEAGFKLADHVPLVASTGGAPLYRLALFSRHDLAKKIWNSLAPRKGQTRDLF